MRIELSPQEAEVVLDALDAWIEEYGEVLDQTIIDKNLESPEELAQASGGLYKSHQLLRHVHRRISDAVESLESQNG